MQHSTVLTVPVTVRMTEMPKAAKMSGRFCSFAQGLDEHIPQRVQANEQDQGEHDVIHN